MELKVLNTSGTETGKKVKLNKEIFAIEPSDHAIYLDVKQYMANGRQGTHKAKERSDVSGSTRKIKRQKGTGTARAGSIKSPLFRGGGRAFGPRPHGYGFKLNKKVKQLARKSALTYKAKDGAIIALEDFTFEEIKTKNVVALLNNLKIADKKSLLILSEQNKNIYLSSRNLQGVEVITASELTTYKVLRATNIVMVESSFEVLDKVFSN
ncbi:MAG: 50S ribosomal protein L4 [Marinilabiliales bacterium]|nr:MAG: 50S ribosomal protein L4 [Marinilabiliales bacterium]